MPLPLLAAGLVAGGAGAFANGVYNVGRAQENQRFWDDYIKNTGRYPRYRYRSGFYDTYQYYAAGAGNFGKSFAYMSRW